AREILRLGPKGMMLYYSSDPTNLYIGAFFSDLLKGAGWRVEELLKPPVSAGDLADSTKVLLIIVVLREDNQIATAVQTLEQLFLRFGFSPIPQSRGEYTIPERPQGTLRLRFIPYRALFGS